MINKSFDYIAIYGAHILKIFTFVILLPHFANVMSPEVWGFVLLLQSLSIWLQTVVEYGFNFSAARQVSVARNEPETISELLGGVIGAKVLLSVFICLISLLAFLFLAQMRDQPLLIVLATLSAVAQGFTPMWYFMGKEKFALFSSIDLVTRVLYLVSCLMFVESDSDAYLIFGLGFLIFSVSNIIGYFIINREDKIQWPKIVNSVEALRDGFHMFLFTGITGIYTTLNVFILGLNQTPAVVANYGTADRIVRSSSGLMDPLNRIIFSKISYLYEYNPKKAFKLLLISAPLVALLGIAICITGIAMAPFIVDVFFPKYPDAAKYISALIIYVPIVSLNSVLGFQIMLPLKMDNAFSRIFIVASLMSLAAMIILLPIYGVDGMIWIIIVTEIFVFISMLSAIILSDRAKNMIRRMRNGDPGDI